MSAANLDSAYAHCGQSLHAQNRDQWLACLFAPADRRPFLHALHAFATELASLRDKIVQPMAGEIRLQYWRDLLNTRAHGETAANPLAVALLDTIPRCKLPLEPFLALIEARLFDLYDDPMADVTALEAYCGETDSAIVRLASLILAGGIEPGGASAAGHAGVALGVTQILRALPRTAARGQIYLPGDKLQKHAIIAQTIATREDTPALRTMLTEMRSLARAHASAALADMGPGRSIIAPAFLLLPVSELALREMDRANYAPFKSRISPPQWQKQWVMWRTARAMG